MSDKLERRWIPIDLADVRAAVEGETPHITGHAAVFNEWARIFNFVERILPGAFDDVLEDDVRLLINHQPWPVLGRTMAGTLTLGQDDRGLTIDNVPPDTQSARELIQALERGDVNQMSFLFRVAENGDHWEFDRENDIWKRTISKYDVLRDVSVVTFPAYKGTDAQARDLGYRAEPPRARGEASGENGRAARIAIERRKLALLELE